MFKIIQSNSLPQLAYQLTKEYQKKKGDVFAEFVVITPAKVLEDWLINYLAKQTGISVLFKTQFWGQYQWQMIANVLNVEPGAQVPAVAVLSQSVVQWRIFDHFAISHQQPSLANRIVQDKEHKLYFLFENLVDGHHNTVDYKKMWRLCQELAKLYVKYLTQRPMWLRAWADNRMIHVRQMIHEKEQFVQKMAMIAPMQKQQENEEEADNESATPEWLIEHYENIEYALRTIWHTLFSDIYHYRESLEGEYVPVASNHQEAQGKQQKRLGGRFWQLLERAKQNPNEELAKAVYDALPNPLYLFTVQQLPPVELNFLKQLSLYVDVVLFHQNPSQMYWSDIVDEQYYLNQRFYNPELVMYKDYGQALLSRLGKSYRDTFAMLASMSGGDNYGGFVSSWYDDFDETVGFGNTLLGQLKMDILNLEKEGVPSLLQYHGLDDSLMVHSCHNLKRQLEVARQYIGVWLNGVSADGTARTLADITIFLPDIEMHQATLRANFGQQVGLDGLVLPAKLTGVSNQSVAELWQAIVGCYELPSGRFYADEFFTWLALPSVYENFGLSFDEMSRACELLRLAGFVRGLDALHLQQSLDQNDMDFRHSFVGALDRLVLSLSFDDKEATGALYPFDFVDDNTMGQVIGEKTAPMPQITQADEPIIASLCRLYTVFDECRTLYDKKDDAINWLRLIEKNLIDRYFLVSRHTESMRAIFDTKNKLEKSIIANAHYETYVQPLQKNKDKKSVQSIFLPLSMVLETLGEQVLAQQISAEPSGVINIGRFGSLRSIPFKLVIMLNMNLSAFPRKDTHSRLDLMKAGKPILGDRLMEEDDNGAFLDALLSAQENCWIFYDGQSLTGEHEKLPATPVKELIKFIQNSAKTDTAKVLVKEFVKKHPALPFAKDLFFKSSHDECDGLGHYPPAPVWQGVRTALGMHKQTLPRFVLPENQYLTQLRESLLNIGHEPIEFDVKFDTLDQIFSVLKNPAKVYLSGIAKVYVTEDEQSQNEQLALGSLEKFTLNQSLLNSQLLNDETTTYFANMEKLPYGVARFGVLTVAKNEMIHLTKQLSKALSVLGFNDSSNIQTTQTILTQIRLSDTIVLTVNLPQKTEMIWTSIRPSNPKNHHFLEAFLNHLAWQMVCDDENGKISVWQFMSDDKHSHTYQFLPLKKPLARVLLLQFYYMAHSLKHQPILIDTSVGMDYVKLLLTCEDVEFSNLEKQWKLENNSYQKKYDGLNDKYWAYLLNGYDEQEVFLSLRKCTEKITPILYQSLWENLYKFDIENNQFVLLKDGIKKNKKL